jgi:glycosyltransferase involved in cell wall biosynthesis
MDLCAEMLLQHLNSEHLSRLQAFKVCPPFTHRLQRLPGLGKNYQAFNGDRLLNRFWDYPQALKPLAPQFDLFHVSDHTYAQLVHVLPPERTGVYCHDIDAFRSLLEPESEPRPLWFRALARRILSGLQRAAVVFYSTAAIRAQIEQFQLIDPGKLVQVPYGIAAEFFAAGNSLKSSSSFPAQPFMLHVGSCIPRKRIDLLLEIFAALQIDYADLQLVQVGGDWSEAQQQQITRLGIAAQIRQLKNLDRAELATLYRQATLVVLTSEAEGFGLPIIEALACGATLVASDLPVLREVGGEAVIYAPVGDITAWVKIISNLLSHPHQAPTPAIRQRQAEKYSWSHHASLIAESYLNLRIPREANARFIR